MKEEEIEYLVYQLEESKKAGYGAIVFIGAGCSVSAGIPTASEIVIQLRDEYKDNPHVKTLPHDATYSQLMKCLNPSQRKKIFNNYVEKAKVNGSHIYLAHLMALKYVDYIVTVNFDNLAQKALALYDIFPPTYDISILNELNTTSLDKQSITYLHGQYNGLWQLNTPEEMNKIIVNNVAKRIFNQISDKRLWIVVGYSGEDPIFKQLTELGRFDNGLYWVGYMNNEPSDRVKTYLLNEDNKDAYWVKGFNADTFFYELNSRLINKHPIDFCTPFDFRLIIQNGT